MTEEHSESTDAATPPRAENPRDLRESEVRYRRAFELSPDAVLIVDRLSLRILEANQAAVHLYRYPKDEFVGMPIAELWAEPGRSAALLPPVSTVDGSPVPHAVHRRRGGGEFPVEVTSATLDMAGRTVVIQIVRDTSDRDRRAQAARAISDAQRRLLDAGEDEDIYTVILSPLLAASGADRISITENDADDDGTRYTRLMAHLDAPTSSLREVDPEFEGSAYTRLGPEWCGPLETGSPVVARVDEFPAASRDVFARQGVRSMLVLPVMVNGAFHGRIDCLRSRDERLWDLNEVATLAAVATALGAAFERRLTVQILRRRTSELTALLEANRAMAASIDYDEVLRCVAQAAGEALGSPECIIWEHAASGDLAAFRCLWERDPKPGVATGLMGSTDSIGTQPGGIERLRTGDIVQTSISDPDLRPANRVDMERYGEKTWLTVPLVFNRRLLGVMILIESEEERVFTTDELRMADALGKQAAVALDNALRHRREEERNRWLGSLVAAGRAVSEAPDPDTGLGEVARLAAEGMETPAAFIYEYLKDRDVLVTRARCAAREVRPDDEIGTMFPVGNTSTDRRTLETGEVFVETISDPTLPDEVRGFMKEFRESTLVNVPLRSRGEILGMLVLIENEQERVFRPEELEFLAAFGEQVTLALTTARLATTDGLTGLANHRCLYERLGHELARARRYGTPVSLLMLDIDDFKTLNDTYGHPAGDEVLRRLGRILSDELRREIDLPARYGGEEFAIVLPNTTVPADTVPSGRNDTGERPHEDSPPPGHAEGAAALAERLRAAVAATAFLIGEANAPAHIAVSIGIASFPDMAQNMDDLVARADAALYAAKRAGKDRVEVYWHRVEEPAPPSYSRRTGQSG